MLQLIQKPKALWILFAATLTLTFGFQLFTPAAGGVLLDSISSLADTRELLATMTPQQKRAHLGITIGLDILYPFAYGGLFAGLCLRFGGHLGMWLACPAFLVLPIDLIENAIQIVALAGDETLLIGKTFLTPTKIFLFILAALLALLCLLLDVSSKVMGQFRR